MSKRTKKITAQQWVFGSLASLIFIESCTKPELLYYENENVITINQSEAGNNACTLVPIILNASEEEYAYLYFLDKLSQDIINDISIAKRFIENPQVYLDENGFSNVKANLDESLLKTILAFSDERITHAIKSNDIQTFIKLCKELGLTNEVEEGDLTMVQGILAKVPELQNLISDLGISKDDENRAAIAWVFFALLAVVGACVFDWALAVSYAVEAVAAHTTAVFNTQVGYNTKTISSGIDNNSNQSKTKIQNASVTLLWLLKGGASNQLPYLWDEENKAFVDEIIQAIKKNYPDFSQDYNVEQIKSLFLLNLNLLT